MLRVADGWVYDRRLAYEPARSQVIRILASLTAGIFFVAAALIVTGWGRMGASMSHRAAASSAHTASTPPGPPMPMIGGNWKLDFDDEFNGTALNPAVWNNGWFATGPGLSKHLNSDERDCYDSNNVSESGGALNLTVMPTPCTIDGVTYPYRASHVDTYKKMQFTYGFFEARVYLPPANGLIANWPAFWAAGYNWPDDGEMDMLEVLSGQACSLFISKKTSNQRGDCTAVDFSGWHTYGADWEPGSVTYYRDGKQFLQVTTGITSAPMYLILNNSVGLLGKGVAAAPETVKVDYVRVWSKA